MAIAFETGVKGDVKQGGFFGYPGLVDAGDTWLVEGTKYTPGTKAGTTSPARDQRALNQDVALVIRYVSGIADTNTLDTGYGTRVLACAWQTDDPDETNPVNVSGNSIGDGILKFSGDTVSAAKGWVWLLVDLKPSGGSASDLPTQG